MKRLTKRLPSGAIFVEPIYSPADCMAKLADLEDNLEKGIAFDLYGASGNGAYLAREDYQARPVVVIPLADSEVKALLEIGIENYLDRCRVVLDNEN